MVYFGVDCCEFDCVFSGQAFKQENIQDSFYYTFDFVICLVFYLALYPCPKILGKKF